MKKELIAHFDCTREYDSATYFEIGKTNIVNSKAGTYREAEYKHLARFGYKFMLRDKTKPHLLVVKYPDDKERFMCITNDSSYDLDTGIACGGINQLSGAMKEIYCYYYPRWDEETVVFTSWGANTPAAVAEFSMYELDCFDESEIDSEVGTRSFGIQYEDPCNVCLSSGAQTTEEFIDNHIRYMKFSGQNHLTYPINWYHGPIIPVECQPSSRFVLIGKENRKRYFAAKRNNISDWLEYWLTRFDEENFSFKGSMTLMRLGRLMQNMNVDEESVKNGADTYNNVLFNGSIQQSLNDWTTAYNPISFDNWLDNSVKGAERVYAYGEKTHQGDEISKRVRVPLFNPLHPEVQNQVIELISEIAQRYAKHSSFKGLAINMWHGTMLWYGNLLAGYDDVSIGMFEKETGISLGIAADDPRRFEKRYIMLTMTLRDVFINWRCKKIHDFILNIRNAIVSKRKDLTLTLTVWNETSASYGYFNSVPGATTGYGARRSFYEVYKEGGLDLSLLKDENNIEIAVEKTSTRDHSENALAGKEYTNMFADTAFLDNDVADVLTDSTNSTAFIFDSWVEMWGQTFLDECDKDDKNISEIRNIGFGDIDFIARENSIYADDTEHKFWFEDQMRITAAFPSGYYLEWIANEIATHDALEVTEGGLYLDMAHAKEQLQFAREYRKLPKCKFNTVDGHSGTAVVRYLEKNGKTYIYAVNREPYTVDIEIKTDTEALKWSLPPFEMKTEIYNEKNIPLSYIVTLPDGVEAQYISDAENAVKKITESFEKGYFIAGANELSKRLHKAIGQKNYPFIRHAMKSQIMVSVDNALNEKAKRSRI